MAMIKKSITLTDQQNAWIQAQLVGGDYASDSELLRDLIRKEQKRQKAKQTIKEALIKGENSGISERTPEQILSDVLGMRDSDAKL